MFESDVPNREQHHRVPQVPFLRRAILAGFVERPCEIQASLDSRGGMSRRVGGSQSLFQNRYGLGVPIGISESLSTVEFRLDLGWNSALGRLLLRCAECG